MLGVFKAFSLKIDPTCAIALGVEIDPLRGIADSGRFSDDLAALFEVLGETARDLGVGVLILVDELQEASMEELTALNTAVHRLGQSDPPLPLTFVGAGLPSLPARLAEATSYAERPYNYKSIGLLSKDAAKSAIVIPARDRNVEWDSEALKSALGTAHGYPYFLQSVGKHVWDNARRSPIRIEDVEIGLREARREVDDWLYVPVGPGDPGPTRINTRRGEQRRRWQRLRCRNCQRSWEATHIRYLSCAKGVDQEGPCIRT